MLRGKKSLPATRSSPLEVFWQKSVFSNFAKFTRKQLCQSLFINKYAGLSFQPLVAAS